MNAEKMTGGKRIYYIKLNKEAKEALINVDTAGNLGILKENADIDLVAVLVQDLVHEVLVAERSTKNQGNFQNK